MKHARIEEIESVKIVKENSNDKFGIISEQIFFDDNNKLSLKTVLDYSI